MLRIQKLKTTGAVAGSGKNNQRGRDTPNVTENRTAQNSQLVGSAEKGGVDAIKEAISSQRIRSNAVFGVEMLPPASLEYFRPGVSAYHRPVKKIIQHRQHRIVELAAKQLARTRRVRDGAYSPVIFHTKENDHRAAASSMALRRYSAPSR